jgi:hypothetical protein
MVVTIPLGIGDWESSSENISRLRLRNMYLTDNPQSPDGVSRVSRPTLTELATVGEGPGFGIWRQDASLNGDWLVVSDEILYRFNPTTLASTEIGSLPGDGYCQFAGTSDRVIIVRDGVAYSTDGVAITVVLLPDDVPGHEGAPAPVGSVATINSFFLLSVLDSQRFYWIEPGGVDPDPLHFASAERIPDSIESISILMDEIWFIGTAGPEVWSPANDPDLPFQRINGRVYSEGCASRDTVVQAVSNNLPCLIWVTATRSVVMAQGSVSKISSEAVEEKLKTATNLRAYPLRHNRHDFYVLTTDEFTYVFDIQRQEWGRWDSFMLENFRAHLGIMAGPVPYAVDSLSGRIWKLEEGLSDNGDSVIREVSGVVFNPGKNIKCSVVCVRVNAGWSPEYEYEPILELRWSDDQGSTWSNYVEISLGDKGEYYTDTIYRSLGLITRPGRNFEFRFSAPARFRIDYAVMNED